MITDTDDYSWEQVYGLMRCTTKFERNIDTGTDDDLMGIDYYNY